MDSALIKDSLQLCFEARKSRNRKADKYCSIARESAVDVLLYHEAETPHYLYKEGVISDLLEHLTASEIGSERLLGYYAIRFNYGELSKWVEKHLFENPGIEQADKLFISLDGKLIFYDGDGIKYAAKFGTYTNSFSLLSKLVNKQKEVIPFKALAMGFREQRQNGESTDEQRVRAAVKAIREKLGVNIFRIDNGVGLAYPAIILPS